jgi:hypothetical protein
MKRIVRLVLTNVLGAAIAVCIVVALLLQPGTLVQQVSVMVLLLATLGTGWLLAVRVPGNVIGWALLVVATIFIAPVEAIADAVRGSAPTVAQWLYWYVGTDDRNWSWLVPVWLLLIWIPLHFPDGRLPSRRWRWFARFAIGAVLYAAAVFSTAMGGTHGMDNPAFIPLVAELQAPLVLVAFVVGLGTLVGTVVSLVVRYRAGTAMARAQLRWIIWGTSIAVGVLAVNWVLSGVFRIDSPVINSITLALYGLIPLSVGIAVLRYRLYEIDRIISRTAAYALVTLITVGTYAAVVLLASAVLRQQGDDVPPIAVAVATLAAAAVFLPLLRLLRRRIDRVFNRSQYDAERVVATFGEQIRNGADPHTAGADLVRAVEASLDPAAVGLWLRP